MSEWYARPALDVITASDWYNAKQNYSKSGYDNMVRIAKKAGLECNFSISSSYTNFYLFIYAECNSIIWQLI